MPTNPVRRVADEVTELFAHPGGRAARPMAHVLNFFNRRGNQVVASALDVGSGDRILEVGFGGGAAIATTTRALGGQGIFCGVDLSADMARLAGVRFPPDRVGVPALFACGDVVRLPLRSRTFDAAYAMHSHLYWPSPAAGVGEMYRVLRDRGRVLLGMDTVSGIRLVRRFGRDYEPADPPRVAALLTEAGFVDVGRRTLAGGVVAVLGRRP